MNDPRWFLTIAAILFAMGMAGFMIRKNLLVVLLSVELMLNAGALALLTFARMHLHAGAQAFFFIVIALAAAESAVGLALIIAVYRQRHSIDTDDLAELRG